MNLFRAAIGAPGSVGMRIALSSMPVVGAAQASAGKLPWTLSALYRSLSGTAARPSHLHFVRQHVSASLQRPAAVQESTWGFSPVSALGLCTAIGGIGFLCGGDAPGAATIALTAAMLLNLSIWVHEAGHLAAARAMGVAVREFSVGIGPRVAWWKGPSTTYSLRALPLLGFVSFLSEKDLGAAVVKGEGKYGAPGVYGAITRGDGMPYKLLTSLSPGRRTVVMAAGVVANVLLAAAFTCWQVVKYGEMGHVVRPGARIKSLGGWNCGGCESTTVETILATDSQQDKAPRLREGDVVLSVGQWRLPRGGAMDAAIVHALQAAARAPPPLSAAPSSTINEPAAAAAAAATTTTGKNMSASPEPSCPDNMGPHGGFNSLDGVKMAVLRTRTISGMGSGDIDASSVSESAVVQLDAADMLRYDILEVIPYLRVEYRHPTDAWEALQMTRRELTRYATVVMECCTELVADAVHRFTTSNISSSSSSSSGNGSSSSQGGSQKFVGPFGIVANATEVVMADTDRVARLVSQGGRSRRSTSHSSSSTSSSNGHGEHDAFDALGDVLYDESRVDRRPHPLLAMGILVNLQLAVFNLLPIPILDGGQLLLLAFEAARGGRRLSLPLERTAMLGSLAVLGSWMVAVNVRDLVGLMDKAAGRLTTALESEYGVYGSYNYGLFHGRQLEQQQRGKHQEGQQQLPQQLISNEQQRQQLPVQQRETEPVDFNVAAAAAV